MNIFLGYWLDSGSYPDALGENTAAAGIVVTGFKGLIHILETQLGLTQPEVSQNIRISEWQKIMHDLDDGKQPYSKSFETDSWNTAKELLRRRDELIIAGWDPKVHTGGSKWNDTLAQLEQANQNKTPGFSDRVRQILKALQSESKLHIEKVTIVDEDITLWDPWAVQLIDLLKKQGVEVVKETLTTEKENKKGPTSDLQLLQEVLAGKRQPAEADGDGSVIFVHSEQEIDAADFLISWLQENGTKDTVLIKEQGSLLLDEMLHRRGVPAAGVDQTSKWRAVLQVLPLTIETYWKPLKVERMLELLTIPTSPVPGLVRYKLAKALSESPGIGGEQWEKAIVEGIQSYEKRWTSEDIDEREWKKRRKNLDSKLDLWVRHEYYHPNEGMPLEKLAEICQKVGQWAATNYQLKDDPIYMHAAQVANEVIEGVKTLGVNSVTHLQVARILDSVLGEGSKLSHYNQEAAKWQVVNHPGQIIGNAETIIWWGFNKNTAESSILTWTSKEREWLRDQGIQLLEENVPQLREAASWQRAVRFADKRLIFISSSKNRGEEVPVHPFWNEIRYAVANNHRTLNKITFNAAELRKNPTLSLFDVELKRSTLKKHDIPAPIRKWKVPENTVLPREEESATSFENLIGCPLKWTFQYAGNILQGNLFSLPNESLMLGNLGHAILEQLITEKTNWDEDEVKLRTGELFDELTPKMAAMLLEPQNSVTRIKTRSMLQKSLQKFFRVLNESGVQLKHTEMEVQKRWHGNVEFKGRLDLVGETKSGKKILFDAKWSKRPKNYKERLENISIQLSLYHWLLVDHENEELPVAYFMLSTGDFFSLPHDDFPSDYHVEGPSLIDSYHQVRKSVEDVWSQLSKGVVIATGVPDNSEGKEDSNNNNEFVSIIDPPCSFCDYQNLCGVGRLNS